MTKELNHDGQSLLQRAGKSGRFQKILCIFILVFCIVVYYNLTVIPLHKIRPKALCKEKEDIFNYKDCSEESYCDPQCEKKIIKEDSINNWTLYFNVDCEGEKTYDYIVSGTFFGALLSYLLLSPWADKYGRKLVLEWEIYGMIAMLILTFFAGSLNSILIIWLIFEFFKHSFTVMMIYATETMSQEYFSLVCSLSSICFAATGLLMSVLFYYFKDWLVIHGIFTILAVGCMIVAKFMIIESPQFCLEKGDVKGFLTAVRKIASVNNTEELIKGELLLFEKKYLHQAASQKVIGRTSNDLLANEGKDLDFFYYFKNNLTFRKEFLIVVMTYAIIQMVYYGLLLNIEKFDANVFLISTIIYTSEIMAEVLSGILAQKYGRVIIIKLFLYLAGVSFFFFQFTLNIFALRIIFCFLGNFGIASSFNVIIIYISEVFDVKIRASATSYCRIPGQITVIFAPYFIGGLSLPFAYFAFFCFVCGYLMDSCHETLEKEDTKKEKLIEMH